jgi:predicted benzoate:H+ symporter BenE
MRRVFSELGGALGDLGTFLPHVVGAVTIAGLAPVGVLFGFGAALIGSGLFYGLPMAVQPMKAVSAVMITGQLDPAEIAATGILIGAILILLAVTGSIGWLARLIPQSVAAGLQLGLGVSMAALGAKMMTETPLIAGVALAVLLGFMVVARSLAVPLALLLSVAAGLAFGVVAAPRFESFGLGLPDLTIPALHDFLEAAELGVLPQLPLTLTNAIIVTALVCRDLFPENARRASERNLALSTGIANVCLAPLGAMPMCHGAGGVQAQFRFGARSGLAPIAFGATLLALAFLLGGNAVVLFALIPAGALGALLVIAGCDLAWSRRLVDSRPECWPAIGLAAAATLAVNPAAGIAAGCLAEIARMLVKRRSAKVSAP